MVRRKRIRHFLSRLSSFTIAGLMLYYFSEQFLVGKFGMNALPKYKSELEILEQELAQIKSKNAKLEQVKGLLDLRHTERDYLDEQVRAVLNMVKPNDIVVFRQNADPASPFVVDLDQWRKQNSTGVNSVVTTLEFPESTQ